MQNLPGHELTLNLHITVCRLADQESCRGNVAFDSELWLEHGMQSVKGPVKYRITYSPEILFINIHLLRLAISRMHYQPPEL